MLTPEEIKKIAREYADGLAKWFPELNERNKYRDKVAQAGNVIRLILRDYCIVPKSKARELRQLVADNTGRIDHGLIDGLSDWVELNLGTELFNEEKG